MSSISDQLLKLGLVDAKRAKKAEHDKRVGNKKRGGGAGGAAERRARDAKAQAQREARRAADRAREIARQAETGGRETQLQIEQMVESGRAPGKTGGRKRFYFEARDGTVPYLHLSDEAFEALANARLAIVESPKGTPTLVVADTAQRIADLDLRWLRLWNG